MKIDASTVDMAAVRRATMRTEVRETLRAWVGNERPDFEAQTADAAGSAPSVVAISAAALSAAQASAGNTQLAAADSGAVADAGDEYGHSPMLYLIKLVVEMLSGFRIKTVSDANFQAPEALPCPCPDPSGARVAQAPARAGYGVEYDRHEIRDESEQSVFSASGIVKTADGKEIRFDLTLEMARSFHEESTQSLRAGDARRKDPLVINFDGSAAQLSSQRFAFDLDADGKKENVAMLAGNRGYLALDLDGNGSIDDGRELFGAMSGDGFAELAQYDSDGNGWIDEADSVYAQLQVWRPDADQGVLTLLKDEGVGAVHLGRVVTEFALRDGSNQDLGAVRSSGVYLTEDGKAGTVQQIDLSV